MAQNDNTNQDNLGISDVEEKQMQALTLGASPEEVASVSKQPVEDIPSMIEPSVFSDEESFNEESEFEDLLINNIDPKEASRKALYGSVARNENIVTDFQTIHNNLLTEGNSFLYEGIQQEIALREEELLSQALDDTARMGDAEGVSQLLQAAPAILKERSDPKVAALETASEAYTETATPVRSRQYQIDYLNGIESRSEVRDRINTVIDNAVANTRLTLPKYYAEGITAGFTGEQFSRLSRVGKDILGEEYIFLGGSMMRDLAQHILNKPLEEQEAEAQRVVDSFVENSGVRGLGSKNEVVKLFALEDFKEFMNAPGGDKPVDRWLIDTFGVIDVVSVIPTAAAVRAVRKLTSIKKSPSALTKMDTVSDELLEANPDLSASLNAASLRSGEVAEKMGTTQGEALAKVLPGSTFDDDTVLQGAPNSFKQKFQGTRTRAEEATNFLDNTFLYADRDYVAKQARIMDVLNAEETVAISKPSMASIKRDEDSNALTVKAVYGDDTDLPLTLDKAKKIQNSLDEGLKSEGLTQKSELLAKNKELGTYEKYSPEVHGEDGPFLVSVNMKARMGYDDIQPGQVRGEGSTKGVGAYGRFFLSPQSYLDRTLLGASRVANDSKFYHRHELLKVAKPFLSLNYFGKKKVAGLLNAGEKWENEAGEVVGKVFSYDELARGGYAPKEIEAYYSARVFNDAVYRVKNQDLRTRLSNDGFKGLTVQRGDAEPFQNAIKQVENPSSLIGKVRSAFDPSTGTTVAITEQGIEELGKQGLVIGKLLRKIDQGAEEYSYAVVKANDITDLPPNVVPYKKGYNFRINNDPYFIDQYVNKIVDGQPERVRKTIGVARNRHEAEQRLKSLRSEVGDSFEFEVRLDRNLSSTDSMLQNDIDTLDGSGLQFWFSKRGDRLQRQDGTESSVEDPISAISSLAGTVSNVGTHRELLDTAIVRHRKTYGNVEVDGKKLWYWDQQKGDWSFDILAAKETGRPDVKAALAEYRYLENLKYSPTNVDVAWKELLEEIDYRMSKLGPMASKISKKVVLDGLGSTSPGHFARGAAFAMTIPLRPVRQLLLQGTTGIHLTGIDPLATMASFRDTNLMLYSFATYQNPKLWKSTRKIAKSLGYDEDEWEEIFTQFRKSGKAYSIDSNVAIGEANFSWARSMPESLLGEAGRVSGNILKSPVTLGKAIGFDTGELANQSLTWLFAKRQWEKANPGKKWNGSKRALDEINAEARNLSVDMTKTDQLSYQKGLFASATQFLSINHKMLLRAIPEFMGGDPSFTGMRGKYILGMMAMYGSAGVGMQTFYDEWKKENDLNIPPQIDDLMYGGFSQALFNTSLDLAFGQELGTSRTAFADSFSPAGGIATFAPNLVESLLEGNFVEALAGPSGNVFPNIQEAATFIGDVWGMDKLDTHEKVIKSMQLTAEQFGTGSDYFRYNMAMAYKDKLDELYVVGRDGRPTAPAAAASDQFAKMLLGLNLRSESELYENWLSKHQELNSSKSGGSQSQIDKDGKHLAKWLYRTWAESKDDWDFAEKANALTFSLHKADRMYGIQVQEAAMSHFKEDPQFSDFVMNIVDKYSILDPNADYTGMRNLVINSDFVPEEDKEQILKHIDITEKSRAQSEEWLKDLYPSEI